MHFQPKSTRSSTIIINSQKLKPNSLKVSRSAPNKLDGEEYDKLREETFQKWLSSKREEQMRKREEERRLKLMELEQERIKRETAQLSYILWKHKKEEERKAAELEERLQKEEQDRLKGLRQHSSRERVNDWMRNSQRKPKPVPSSLGLLSLSTNPPTFYNPRPWVDPIKN